MTTKSKVHGAVADLINSAVLTPDKVPLTVLAGISAVELAEVQDRREDLNDEDYVVELDEVAHNMVRREQYDASRDVMAGDIAPLIGWIEPEDLTDIRYALQKDGYDCPPWYQSSPHYFFGLTNDNVLPLLQSFRNLMVHGFSVTFKPVPDVEGHIEVTVTQPAPKADA